MPFPVAHPAAVSPLRRYCPRYLCFPALVAGSLAPDVGYVFGHRHVDWFSHRFWAGSFGFCLPAGLLLDLLYAGFTFFGAAWLVACYLRWLEQATGSPTVSRPAMRLSCAVLIGAATLALAKAGRGEHQLLGLMPLGIVTVAGVLGFIAATVWLFAAKPGHGQKSEVRSRRAEGSCP